MQLGTPSQEDTRKKIKEIRNMTDWEHPVSPADVGANLLLGMRYISCPCLQIEKACYDHTLEI